MIFVFLNIHTKLDLASAAAAGAGALGEPSLWGWGYTFPSSRSLVGGGGGNGTLMEREPFEQILRTRAESQRIVTARSLCRLQYPVRAKSSAKDLPQRRMELSCLAPKPGVWPNLGEPTDMLLHSEEPNVFLDG